MLYFLQIFTYSLIFHPNLRERKEKLEQKQARKCQNGVK